MRLYRDELTASRQEEQRDYRTSTTRKGKVETLHVTLRKEDTPFFMESSRRAAQQIGTARRRAVINP